MLSQDLFGWGLSGEQSVAALLLPLADASGGAKPKSPSAGMGWGKPLIDQAGMAVLSRRLEWDGESPLLTRLAWACSGTCLMFV